MNFTSTQRQIGDGVDGQSMKADVNAIKNWMSSVLGAKFVEEVLYLMLSRAGFFKKYKKIKTIFEKILEKVFKIC